MSSEKVITTALMELTYTEYPPGSNCTKYGAAYGLQNQPWCVIFLWWVFREAGESRAFYGGAKTSSCGTLLRWYRAQGQTVSADDIRIGDIVILNFSGTQDTQHCGLVVGVGEKKIYTVEGNTTPGEEGSQSNGGCVASKTRFRSQVVGVCRPEYSQKTEKESDWKGHWAENEIRWGIERGLIKGYEDDTIRPDAGVTRAELMVILKRLEDGRK